jgi:hypothetical protein
MNIQQFQCPACNAPLNPKGFALIISCAYCHTSVVVPEELRQASGATGWATHLYDSFVSNENRWLVGSYPSDYFARLDQFIADGRYRWQAQVTIPSTLTTAWLANYPVSDFHLTANGKHISGSKAGSSYGVIFRIQDNYNFYWFRITDNQFFAVSVVKNGQWQSLVDWKRTDAIKPFGVNQLEVIAHENHFTFKINGQIVGEVENEQFSRGFVGLAIEGYAAGEEITFDFLDFMLRAP